MHDTCLHCRRDSCHHPRLWLVAKWQQRRRVALRHSHVQSRELTRPPQQMIFVIWLGLVSLHDELHYCFWYCDTVISLHPDG
jgi:hypothetical protein